MKIEGLSAIVTGAAGGIGRSTAKMLLDAGAARVGVMVRDPQKLEALLAELGSSDGRVVALPCDVANEEAVTKQIAAFVETAGTLDVLVNNAGVLIEGALFSISFKGVARYPLSSFDQTMATNVTGAFLCARAAVEWMVRKRRAGVIVNVSSISRNGIPGHSAYAASKGAITSMTFTWAKELAVLKIRACAVAPGLVDTPMAAQIAEKHREEMLSHMAVHRMGKPEEIAHGVRFCIENDFFNGKVLELDGGTFG